MSNPSPYDLISKAARSVNAADRWAALQTNTRASFAPVSAPQEPSVSAAQGAAESPCRPSAPTVRPPRPASHPELIDPPFPPPQPRHAALDDIALRHRQACTQQFPLRKNENTEQACEQKQVSRREPPCRFCSNSTCAPYTPHLILFSSPYRFSNN